MNMNMVLFIKKIYIIIFLCNVYAQLKLFESRLEIFISLLYISISYQF